MHLCSCVAQSLAGREASLLLQYVQVNNAECPEKITDQYIPKHYAKIPIIASQDQLWNICLVISCEYEVHVVMISRDSGPESDNLLRIALLAALY